MIALDLREIARERAPKLTVDEGLREAAIGTWLGRMTNEYQSSFVFEALAEQLSASRELAQFHAEALGFATEERRHGVICGAVVEALGGRAIGVIDDAPAFPAHAEVEHDEALLRNVLSIGCLSETIAVSLIGAEREEMPASELRDLLTNIWADEIGHARFGWRLVSAYVPKQSVDARRRMSAYLRVALRHLESHELAHLPDSGGFGGRGNEVGLCSGRDARTLFYATVERVIVPRLSSLGLDAEWAWRHRHQTRAQAA